MKREFTLRVISRNDDKSNINSNNNNNNDNNNNTNGSSCNHKYSTANRDSETAVNHGNSNETNSEIDGTSHNKNNTSTNNKAHDYFDEDEEYMNGFESDSNGDKLGRSNNGEESSDSGDDSEHDSDSDSDFEGSAPAHKRQKILSNNDQLLDNGSNKSKNDNDNYDPTSASPANTDTNFTNRRYVTVQ